ncbi:MAG TPA: phosphoglycerate dehydrogenase [Phycisphaerales bacterium]|nr:phosphoglycerate dehydrogenase [Phycisphaerales bacterium]
MATSYPLNKIKVVLLEGIHPRAVELLRAAGFTVETHAKALSGRELIEAAGDAHLVGIRSKTKLTPEFFEQATRLWGVGCYCIGTNQVSLDAAAEKGVAVFNAPFSNTRSVAELTLAEIVALQRGLVVRSAEMHAGVWKKTAVGFHEVRGRTLGIVGYGRIGSQLSVLAENLGMCVVFYDAADRMSLGNASATKSLDELLERADIVSLHVPLTESTRGMMGAAQFAKMKKGSLFINNARGEVVDPAALAGAVKSGHIAGAAVDVFPVEPEGNDEMFESPLRGLANVILTPHVAGSTEEAQKNIAEETSGKLTRFMNNGTTSGSVNFPEVELPLLHDGKHRVLHYHHNVPGVLSKLHGMIAELGVNIFAEYLQSNPRYSYVILDISPEHGEAVREGLKKIPETIRVRALW